MSKKKITFIMIASFILAVVILVPWAYKKMDAGYQSAMDPVRISDGEEIAALIFEYEAITGALPFAEEAEGKPFMVVIGHSLEEEDFYAKQDVLDKGATFANSKDLKAKLEGVLKRQVILPTDPQKVATFAPNVYVYFLAGKQFTIAVHLFESSDESVEYKWKDGVFHSHAVTYSRETEKASD